MGWKDLVQPIVSAALGSKVGEYAGSIFNTSKPGKQRRREYERQKEFAQNSISWRVQDAIRAGLHPLAALGAQVSSYAPQSVGGGGSGSFGDMGADLSSAMNMATAPDDKVLSGLILEKAGLENELLRTQIDSLRAKNAQAGIALVTSPFTRGEPPLKVAQPNLNDLLQPHYGEGADVVTAPWLIYDMARRPGNIADPRFGQQILETWRSWSRGSVPSTFDVEPWY